MKKLAFLVPLLALALLGCKSEEEQANENALKSRNAQFSQMGGHGTGAGSKAPVGAPPSSGSAAPPSSATTGG